MANPFTRFDQFELTHCQLKNLRRAREAGGALFPDATRDPSLIEWRRTFAEHLRADGIVDENDRLTEWGLDLIASYDPVPDWTPRDVATLRKLYPVLGPEALAERWPERCRKSITDAARRYGAC